MNSHTKLSINKERCHRNIEKMALKCQKHKVSLRPHVMAHCSLQITEWYRQFGIDKIAVSSLQIANYFADNGWEDITVTVPINIHDKEQLITLNNKIKLQTVVEHLSTLEELMDVPSPISIYLKIDTDGEMLGIPSTNIKKIQKIIGFILKNPSRFNFKGFMAHPYHTFTSETRHKINNIHYTTILQLTNLKNQFLASFPHIELIIGDTLSALICNDFRNITEIQPSTFIFNDALTWKLGACKLEDIALKIHTSVIAKNKSRNEIILQANEHHITRNSYINIDGKELYGRVFREDKGKKTLLGELNYIHKISLTHATIKVTPSEFFKIQRGDIIEIIPVKASATFKSCQWGETEDGEIIQSMPNHFGTYNTSI
ncbi:alanine racemase [Halosquirtibacter laminarini]|uniref:Alanine racemase n=1 Tax=Halosquirtibacter laminarini TaxID=3374600 RepID=A0AC61NCM4_9BACT|nr:alanine racemase [Prolixibacteraceae bacterium]